MAGAERRRWLGTLLGLAIGDALGAAAEFQPPGTFEPVISYRAAPSGRRAMDVTDGVDHGSAYDSIFTIKVPGDFTLVGDMSTMDTGHVGKVPTCLPAALRSRRSPTDCR